MTKIAPTNFVIFGVTGDLANRYLLPALFDLFRRGDLPEDFFITGFSRRPFSREDYELLVRKSLDKKNPAKSDLEEFLAHTAYEQGNFDDPESYIRLGKTLAKRDEEFGRCSNKLFHLAVPPDLYEGILRQLSVSGLTIPCSDDKGWTRVLLEKPFGKDTASAAHLDALLGELFEEKQIFRIDHYLAKETLQNILAFRFGNSMFEPLWNAEHIESVKVALHERIGIEGRGATFDGVGLLRDVGQNHVLQMLALVAMDEPARMDAASIRAERAKIFSNLSPASFATGDKAVRAQYDGYLDEKNVSPDSLTETFFRIVARIESNRWKGVPFILESGKALSEHKAEVVVTFKSRTGSKPNVLAFRIQPDEGISLSFCAKKPGLTSELEEKRLSFLYKHSPDAPALPNAYEKVIYDAVIGDQTLFASTEEIAASWNYITPILEKWKALPLVAYPKGAAPESIS